jgi:hypothetical protein
MSTRTSKRRKKGEGPYPGTGPLTEEEMKNWSRRLQIKRMIEGGPSLFDTDERAYRELSAYRSMSRIVIEVRKSAALFLVDRSGKRKFHNGAAALAALGFRPEWGMKFVLMGANITPEKKPKKQRKA